MKAFQYNFQKCTCINDRFSFANSSALPKYADNNTLPTLVKQLENPNMAFDASICWRVSVFLSKCSTLFQSNVLDFLLLFSAFVKLKTAINQKFRNTNHPSGIRLPYCSKPAVNWKIAIS